jgi:hypothetical protein
MSLSVQPTWQVCPPPWPLPPTPPPGLMGALWMTTSWMYWIQSPEDICGQSSTHIRWGCPRWRTTCLLAAHGMIALIMGTAQPRLDQPTDCQNAPLLVAMDGTRCWALA